MSFSFYCGKSFLWRRKSGHWCFVFLYCLIETTGNVSKDTEKRIQKREISKSALILNQYSEKTSRLSSSCFCGIYGLKSMQWCENWWGLFLFFNNSISSLWWLSAHVVRYVGGLQNLCGSFVFFMRLSLRHCVHKVHDILLKEHSVVLQVLAHLLQILHALYHTFFSSDSSVVKKRMEFVWQPLVFMNFCTIWESISPLVLNLWVLGLQGHLDWRESKNIACISAFYSFMWRNKIIIQDINF